MTTKIAKKHNRQVRVRHKVRSVAKGRMRLTVFRSNKHIYAQIIDDTKGKTIVSATDHTKEKTKKLTKLEKAQQVGAELAKLAAKAKVKHIYFDRGHYKFHGRVKALAQAARENGLEF